MGTADGANELTQLHDSDGWTYFGYDANGNTVMEQAPSYTRYFDWDGRDMLIGVRSTEAGWTDNEIRYDGLASRAELVDSTGTTRYAWDGIRVLKLEDEEGTLKQRQVHGYAPIPSVGDIAIIESADGDPYAPVADQVGTVVKVLGSAGAVANAYQHDAFGVSRGVSESFANPFRPPHGRRASFAGKPLDPDSAFYHVLARQYDSALGRFATRDSLRGTASISYRYADAYGPQRGLPAAGNLAGEVFSGLGSPDLFWTPRLDLESALRQYKERYYGVTLGGSVGGGLHRSNDSANVLVNGHGAGRVGSTLRAAKAIACGLAQCEAVSLYLSNIGPAARLDMYLMKLEAARTFLALREYARKHNLAGFHYGFSHCTVPCVTTVLRPDRFLAAFSAMWINECMDFALCLVLHDEGYCYSAMQESDYMADVAGIAIGLGPLYARDKIGDELPEYPRTFDAAFDYCTRWCIRFGYGWKHQPTPPGPMWDIIFPERPWDKISRERGNPDYWWRPGAPPGAEMPF